MLPPLLVCVFLAGGESSKRTAHDVCLLPLLVCSCRVCAKLNLPTHPPSLPTHPGHSESGETQRETHAALVGEPRPSSLQTPKCLGLGLASFLPTPTPGQAYTHTTDTHTDRMPARARVPLSVPYLHCGFRHPSRKPRPYSCTPQTPTSPSSTALDPLPSTHACTNSVATLIADASLLASPRARMP